MHQRNPAVIEKLLEKQASLCERLERGREVIKAEEDKGGSRADLYFEKWLSLLTDYEQTIDSLRALGTSESLISRNGQVDPGA